MDKFNQALEGLTAVLLQANVAIPTVGMLIAGVVMLFKAVGVGGGPSGAEIADMLERQIDTTDANVRARLAETRAMIGHA